MEMKVSGLEKLDEALTRLGAVTGERVMRQALFAATKPILDQAKRHLDQIHGGSGALHQAMGRTYKKSAGISLSASGSAQGTRFVMQIGPRLGVRSAINLHNLFYRRSRRGIFYGHLVEFGHRIGHRGTGTLKKLNRPGGRGAMAVGFVRPQPFLRPALEAKSLEATLVFSNQMRKRVERALRKQNPAADQV